MTEMTQNDASKLSVERHKELADRAKARMIVQEVLNYGVSDRQNREIIRLLALELEDREVMLKIFEFLGCSEEQQETTIYT